MDNALLICTWLWSLDKAVLCGLAAARGLKRHKRDAMGNNWA